MIFWLPALFLRLMKLRALLSPLHTSDFLVVYEIFLPHSISDVETRETKPRKVLSGKENHPRGKMWRKREAYAEISSVTEAGGHDDSWERNSRLWKQVTYTCLWERPVAHSKPHVLGLADMLMWSQTLSYKQGIFKKIKIIQMKRVSLCNELVKHLTTVQFMFNIRNRDTVH